jgi:hypothetical protein
MAVGQVENVFSEISVVELTVNLITSSLLTVTIKKLRHLSLLIEILGTGRNPGDRFAPTGSSAVLELRGQQFWRQDVMWSELLSVS